VKQTALKPARKKKCKHCGDQFTPFNSMQQTCTKVECCVSHGKVLQKKQNKKELIEYRAKNKTRSDWIKEAQKAFNAFIRERDKNLPCVSCGCFTNDYNLITGSRWDAGHYRSIGSAPELRFTEINCFRQCVKCNRNLSGNIVEYRRNLITRISEKEMIWLEGHHEPQKWTIDDLQEITKYYRDLRKSLQT